MVSKGVLEINGQLNLRRLRLLAQVVRHGSFTDAAESLGLSQPALSKNIRLLEKSVGVKLLERGRFGARPTVFGLTLVRHSDAIDAELNLARSEIQSLKLGKAGSVIIGCGPSEASRVLPQAIGALQISHPRIKVSVLHGLNESLLPMVKHGDVDLSLSSIAKRCNDPDLKQVALYEDQGVVVARANHPLTKRGIPLSIQLLATCDWILPRPQELERVAFDNIFLNSNISPPIPIVETTSSTLMKSLVLQSDCLSFLPKELVYWEIQSNRLKGLPIEMPVWERTVGITIRARCSPSPAMNTLIAELVKISGGKR
tara:strand:- start:233 stop:1174 length:942 start_codon:yes stop_codon:yes gene_type:complete